MQKDEENVRAACAYLLEKVIPGLVRVSARDWISVTTDKLID